LPSLLASACRRWDLTPGEQFLLSYNFVCSAARADGTPAVLKIGVPNQELTSEIETLRTYDGQGACGLLESDAARGMLLLERIQPGTMLAMLEDDDKATGIAADLMTRIRRPVPEQESFLSLRTWFDGLKDLRPRFGGGTGSFPEKTVEMVEALVDELLSGDSPQVLLHGDLHHFNILLSARGWLAIDPKGVIGPAEYEAAPLLLNPLGKMPEESEAIRRTERRISILAERLRFDRRRLRAWAICHSLLSAWWDLNEDGSGDESARAWTEIFLKTHV
jgi:streptomycin 6-kinase